MPDRGGLQTDADWARFEGKPEVRYELIDGHLVEMGMRWAWHADVAMRALLLCHDALHERSPQHVLPSVGGVIEGEMGVSVLVPDVVVADDPIELDEPIVRAPRLVVEVISPPGDTYDKTLKLQAYKRHPTVKEIWLLWSTYRVAIIGRRISSGDWRSDEVVLGDAAFASEVLGRLVHLEEFYRFVPRRTPRPVTLPFDPETP